MSLPNVLHNFNVFVDGVGFVGLAASIKTPDISKKMQEFQNAGMAGMVEIPVGWEKMEAEMKFMFAEPALVRLLDSQQFDAVQVRAVGEGVNAQTGTAVEQELMMRGNLKKYTPAELTQGGDKAEVTFALSVTYVRHTLDGDTLFELDVTKPFAEGSA